MRSVETCLSHWHMCPQLDGNLQYNLPVAGAGTYHKNVSDTLYKCQRSIHQTLAESYLYKILQTCRWDSLSTWRLWIGRCGRNNTEHLLKSFHYVLDTKKKKVKLRFHVSFFFFLLAVIWGRLVFHPTRKNLPFNITSMTHKGWLNWVSFASAPL